MGYDPAGNLAWSASGLSPGSVCDAEGDTAAIEARRVDRGYDQLDRITSLAFPDARGDTTYTYTPDGLQAQLSVTNFTNNLVKTTYAYNTRRLLAQETMQWDLITWPVTYGYDKYGHVLQQTYPGPLTVNYAPNALGQATQAGIYATGVTYFPNGAIASFDYGNGITHTLTQNARQLPMRSKDAFGASTTYLDDSYDYDQNGNVLAISDGLSGARGDRDMTYDNLDRLTSVKSLMYSSTATAGTIYFGYDALDNITTVSAWNRSQRYCYDTAKNQLTFIRTPASSTCPNGGAATTALSYDVQGNVSSKNNNVYAFDFGNRLRSATDGTTTTTYVYDALGRRVRDITGSSRYSLYTQAGQIAYTSDARKNEATNYIYLGGSLVATSRLPTGSSTPIVEYQHTDALGTPVVVTNASRGILEKSEYEPYGTVINRQKHDGPGFTGHMEDASTGLTYMQQRYYDPMVGRFLSVDPVTAYSNPVGAFNRYWYASNNPFKFKDPDGRTVDYVRTGSVTKEQQDDILVNLAWSGTARDELRQLERSDQNYIIRFGDGTTQNQFNDQDLVVNINVETNDKIKSSGESQSIELVAAHEISHAAEYDRVGADAFAEAMTQPTDAKGNATGFRPEEVRATSVEQQVARELNLPSRKDYGDIEPANER